MTRTPWLVLAAVLAACGPTDKPQTGSQTNWLTLCGSAEECGGLECVCGACTASCESEAACSGLSGGTCVAASDEAAVALCDGRPAEHDVCLPRCDASCDAGTRCIAGVCVPERAGDSVVQMSIDTSVRHQELLGLGASLAFAEDEIVARPDKAALYDLAFADSGLDAVRLGNRYDAAVASKIASAAEIVAAASERIGRTPLLFMTSSTPPASLKASGSRVCRGNARSCTLSSLPDGAFDYSGFARYWRDALAAYAAAGIVPDYVSIQNNPNWVPPVGAPNEACRFLPEEGMTSVVEGQASVDVAYPGYREALAAVRAAIAELPAPPRVAGPETSGLAQVSEYMPVLGAESVDALALHLYGQDAMAIDVAALAAARERAAQLGLPVFQTEMQADGLETAVFVHHALTAGGASVYLQNDLVALTPAAADIALILLTSDGFEAQDPYYALQHFAKHTDPGFVRVELASDDPRMLGSAWLAPDERALTVVLVNSGGEEREVELGFADGLRARLARSEVTRTTFEGSERAAVVGDLTVAGRVRSPAYSIVTIALTNE